MKKLALYIIALAFIAPVFSQRKGLHKFKHYDGKDYIFFGVGPNFMFGDAGGATFPNMWATEWDVLYTRPSAFLGYQHDWNNFIGNKVSIMYSLFAGDDDKSRNSDHRGYGFKTTSFEASFQTQIYVFRGKFKRKTYDVYGYFGLAGIQYNVLWSYKDPLAYPTSSNPNDWIPYHSTYAQGYKDRYENPIPDPGRRDRALPGDDPIDFHAANKEYNEDKQMWESTGSCLAIPFGAGVRFPVTNELYLGGEFGWRYPIGADADFFDGYYTKWSNMNDSYANLSIVLTYRFLGDDDCYAQYGRSQYKFRR